MREDVRARADRTPHDIQAIRREIEALGLAAQLRALEARTPVRSTLHLVWAWVMALGSLWAVVHVGSAWLVAPAMLVIATCQRRIGNLMHEAAHDRAAGSRSSRLRQGLLAAPLLEEFDRYRGRHIRHHAYLEQPARDPELYAPPRAGTAATVYLDALRSRKAWLGNFVGDLGMSRRAWAQAAAWWLALSVAIACVGGVDVALLFVALWLGARATFFHAINVFTVMVDHVGLPRDSVLSSTRHSPKNLFSYIVHPLNDGYHVAHHLAPRVPIARISEAHRLLLHVDAYRRGHQCDGYFFGRSSVWRSLGGARAPA